MTRFACGRSRAFLGLSCFIPESPSDKERMEPIPPSARLRLFLASSSQADARARLSPRSPRCHWLTFSSPGTFPGQWEPGFVLLQRHPMLQTVSSACGSPIQRVSSWDLCETLGFEEMSGFHLCFGWRCEFFQALNPCFAQSRLRGSGKV